MEFKITVLDNRKLRISFYKKLPDGTCREYEGLTPLEAAIIGRYHKIYDPNLLLDLIRDGVRLTNAMRNFIADTALEKFKRPTSVSKTRDRDLEIYGRVMELSNEMNLATNKDVGEDGAFVTISSGVRGLSDGAVREAYYRVKHEMDAADLAEEEIQRLIFNALR